MRAPESGRIAKRPTRGFQAFLRAEFRRVWWRILSALIEGFVFSVVLALAIWLHLMARRSDLSPVEHMGMVVAEGSTWAVAVLPNAFLAAQSIIYGIRELLILIAVSCHDVWRAMLTGVPRSRSSHPSGGSDEREA